MRSVPERRAFAGLKESASSVLLGLPRTGTAKFLGPEIIGADRNGHNLATVLFGGSALSGFYFPLFSMVFPWGSSIWVENGGFLWKGNCCKVLQIYVHFFHAF